MVNDMNAAHGEEFHSNTVWRGYIDQLYTILIVYSNVYRPFGEHIAHKIKRLKFFIPIME